MKRLITLLALAIFLLGTASAQTESAVNAEILLKIFDEDLGVRVTINDTEVADVTFDEPTCSGWHWVGENSGDKPAAGCEYDETESDEIVKLQFTVYSIAEEAVPQPQTYTFYYIQCEDNVPESLNFYCPNNPDGTKNDLYLYIYGLTDIRVLPDGFLNYDPINQEITETDWLVPHNLDVICGTPACSAAIDITYFIAPVEGPTFDLAPYDLTVGSNRSWSVDQVTLRFASGTGINVFGSLDVSGSTVSAMSGSSSWAGISYEPGSTGSIDNATIADAGIWIDDAQVEIDSTIVVGTTGSAAGIGVEGSSAEVDISYSTISNFLWAVLYTDYADGAVHHDTLDGSSHSFAATFYADPGLTGVSSPPGGNQLYSATRTIGAWSGATVVGGIYPYNGANHICDGGTHDIYADDAAVYFYGNYWPSSPVFTEVGSGDIQEGNRLGDPCTAGKGWGGTLAAEQPEVGMSEKLVRALDRMAQAASQIGGAASSLYDEAAVLLMEVEADSPGSPDALTALVALFRLSRLQDTERYIDTYRELASRPGPDRATARDILVEAYRYFGHETEAREAAEAIAKNAEGNWHAFLAQITLFEMDLASGQLAGAASRLESAIPISEADEFRLYRAVEDLVRAGGTVGRLNERAQKEPASTEYPLVEVEAFPNPFNPTTVVQLRIPDDSRVEVVVFDLLGRQVDLLHRGLLVKGMHTVAWDAGQFPSGTYFVIVRAGGAVRTLPIVLQK